MAAGWTSASTTASNVWFTTNTMTTGTTATFVTPTNPYYIHSSQVPHYITRGEMIRELEAHDYVVLQKRRLAIAPRLMVSYLNDCPSDHTDDATFQMREFYGYALPEKVGNYLMPDGSTLHVDSLGNYEVRDQDSKVTYKANRVREFNPYLNASDLLEQFIKEVGTLDGVKQTEVLKLPLEAFIYWLILQAAKKDGDSLEGLPEVKTALPPPIPRLPRCQSCGRFLSKAWAAMRISFCSQEHMKRFQSRALVVV